MASNSNATNGDETIKDDSPFPSGSDMDLDMWRASRPNPDASRFIESVGNTYVAKVLSDGSEVANGERDTNARRIEMLGDLYEALRRAAEKMSEAGLEVGEEHAVLAEFLTPKPFPEGG